MLEIEGTSRMLWSSSHICQMRTRKHSKRKWFSRGILPPWLPPVFSPWPLPFSVGKKLSPKKPSSCCPFWMPLLDTATIPQHGLPTPRKQTWWSFLGLAWPHLSLRNEFWSLRKNGHHIWNRKSKPLLQRLGQAEGKGCGQLKAKSLEDKCHAPAGVQSRLWGCQRYGGCLGRACSLQVWKTPPLTYTCILSDSWVENIFSPDLQVTLAYCRKHGKY